MAPPAYHTTSARMAEHRKSDQSSVYLCDGGLRKRASKLNCHLVIRWIEYHAIATPSAITQYGMIPAWDPPDSAIPSTVSNMPINAHVPHKKTRYWLRSSAAFLYASSSLLTCCNHSSVVRVGSLDGGPDGGISCCHSRSDIEQRSLKRATQTPQWTDQDGAESC